MPNFKDSFIQLQNVGLTNLFQQKWPHAWVKWVDEWFAGFYEIGFDVIFRTWYAISIWINVALLRDYVMVSIYTGLLL